MNASEKNKEVEFCISQMASLMTKRYDGIKYKLGCGDVHTEW